MDYTTLTAVNLNEQPAEDPADGGGGLAPADSGVGDSVGSSHNMVANNRNQTFYNRLDQDYKMPGKKDGKLFPDFQCIGRFLFV